MLGEWVRQRGSGTVPRVTGLDGDAKATSKLAPSRRASAVVGRLVRQGKQAVATGWSEERWRGGGALEEEANETAGLSC